MYEIFTYGQFEVEPDNQEAFVETWTEFASWVSARPGAGSIRLFRDVRNPGRFISFGEWDDADAVRRFKSAPEFKEGLASLVRLAAGVRADGACDAREGDRRIGGDTLAARGPGSYSRADVGVAPIPADRARLL